jgi:L,D-peptidoglycan transpeptidase YkuD (ErfK/YbiS/YcfS/YnhG family)
MSSGSLCVDDPSSALYNLVVDPDTFSVADVGEAGEEALTWRSAKAMRRDLVHGDDLYKWGAFVGFNEERKPGHGSCIFLHIWRGPDDPTAGCTAMAQDDLLRVLKWLRFQPSPLFVQGTRAYLERLRHEGALPYPVPGVE